MPDFLCRLYLISPPNLPDLDQFADTLHATLSAGDVACLQLRLKTSQGDAVSEGKITEAAEKILPITQQHNVSLLINDRPDIAKKVGADGVHIGQQDASYYEARQLLGDDASIGVTCHDSRHLALLAAEQGADYVAFGAFFPTSTKIPPSYAEPSLLSWWQAVTTVPCVAIGGINPKNCNILVQAGADFLAVSASVWDHPQGPASGIIALNKAITDTQS